MADASINVDEEPLMFQTKCGGEEGNEEEKGQRCKCIRAGLPRCKSCGIWRVVAWVYTQLCQWSDFGVVTLLPCSLFAYMLLYCPPLDIDLSYSAFEVNSHFAERFNTLQSQ